MLKWYGEEQEKRFLTGTEMGIRACGFYIERDAEDMCRVDTGRLRASISINWTGSGMTHGKVEAPAKNTDGVTQSDKKNFTVKVGTNVEYAMRLEFGFVGKDSLGRKYNQPARPYLFPAYEMNIKKLPALIKGELPGRATISLMDVTAKEFKTWSKE